MNFDFSVDFSLTYCLLTIASFRIGVPSILFDVTNRLFHKYDLKDSFYHLFCRSASSMRVNIHVSLSIRGEAQPRLQLFRSLSKTHQLCSADPTTNTSKMWEARFPFPVRPQGLQHQTSDGEE